MAEPHVVDSDSVEPEEIEHKCEEVLVGERLEQRYSYLVYHFICDGRYFWARAYVDDIDTVSVYGPFDGRDTMNHVLGPLHEGMLSYLMRRFGRIQVLETAGYVTLWSREVDR